MTARTEGEAVYSSGGQDASHDTITGHEMLGLPRGVLLR
jgi:hypothetical protein